VLRQPVSRQFRPPRLTPEGMDQPRPWPDFRRRALVLIPALVCPASVRPFGVAVCEVGPDYFRSADVACDDETLTVALIL
jgi:hypothetical protein